MALIGVLFLVLAVVLAIGIVTSGPDPVPVEAFGNSIEGLSVGGLFLLGAATGAVALGGLVLALGGANRHRARRRAERHEVREVRSERESLAEENARLQRELDEQRDASTYPADPDGPAHTSTGVREDVDAGSGKHRRLGR